MMKKNFTINLSIQNHRNEIIIKYITGTSKLYCKNLFFFSNHKQLNFYIILNEGGYACLRPLSPPASGAPQQYNWETSTGGSVE